MSAAIAEVVGTLESTSLGALLVRALDEHLTGTFVFEEPNGLRHGIFFEAGGPRRARISASASHLGEVLVETGALSSVACERTLGRALAERVLHGQILLNEGLISAETLELGLTEQLARRVSWLFGQPHETRYGYFADKDLLPQETGPAAARLNPLELLWRGLRDHARSSEIEAAIAGVVGRRVAIVGGLRGDHFGFMGGDGGIVEHLRRTPEYITDLIASAPELETNIKRVVCFLVLTRSMELGYPTAPPAGSSAESAGVSIPPAARTPSFTPPPSLRPSSVPAPSVPPTNGRPSAPAETRRPSGSVPPLTARSATLREEARQRLERVAAGHYEVLGVGHEATPAQIQAAFFRLAKRWHPDRLGAEAASLRASATRIFSAAAEANRVLSDPELRREYDRGRATGEAGESDHEAMARVLAAELAFQKAEAYLQRGNVDAARRELRQALERDPERPEALALHAWLSVLEPNADIGRVSLALSRARRAAPNSPRVHYYAGLVLKRLGRHGSALRSFRSVLEREPRNIDAAREVRLYEMNLRNSPRDHPSLAPPPVEAPSSDEPPTTWRRFLKRS
ncbi:MAG TPA: DnaJ domain-containing protein [Polyangiaceae bacterium]|nr:DnaJ domain-containing protein [Polyangiaceae bacterium]